jgi:hypothetical protein
MNGISNPLQGLQGIAYFVKDFRVAVACFIQSPISGCVPLSLPGHI